MPNAKSITKIETEKRTDATTTTGLTTTTTASKGEKTVFFNGEQIPE